MKYWVSEKEGVNFAPDTEVEEILQNVRVILSTIKGSVPLDRDFGVDASYLDKPINVAKAMLSSEIIKAVRAYEPRVTITAVDFTANLDGTLKPKIEVRINGTE